MVEAFPTNLSSEMHNDAIGSSPVMTLYDEFFGVLSAISPTFEHSTEDILFIELPSKFHSTILDLIRSSKDKLYISSLYIGCSATKGDDLSKQIISALREKLATTENENFTLKILVDDTRSARALDNSTVVLEALKDDFPHLQVEVHPIVVSESFFSRSMGRFFRKSEAISRLQHMKYIVSDDNVLLTGANLSEEYFTTRKDRYVLIKNAKPLASFYSQLTTLVIEATCQMPPPRKEIRDKFLDLLQLKSSENKPAFETRGDKVYLFPSLQMSWLGIRHEEALITTLLGMARNLGLQIHMSTAYFNLAPVIQRYFSGEYFSSPDPMKATKTQAPLSPTNADAKARPIPHLSSIITAAPSCSGFFNAQWPKSLIPDIYENLYEQFASNLKEKDISNFELLQYQRPGWTYHAKGIFLAHNGSVFLTQIGSSNYGILLRVNPIRRKVFR
ncbi:hypothetical protein DI09_118p80 [Mitosporidium daphniae]|uniref:CDP-diacylglycerol--glycerol-3-phosphate 3-phosphatidyltransferase n=2 Tax=Mitosporidium daphniae TaxID=1485682 RepID=A0A098VV72_9MICR|nr:uncharacterized protein DI09_118p80 [Mitosporidium daphniae]KGG53013.1 hypothetical protein DI09_118p80 [Mitosporidium daphniae]|eukprot:XP_013239449.1 uncharacterized protein DI09_118p80 [Mitosporidium daphniae]